MRMMMMIWMKNKMKKPVNMGIRMKNINKMRMKMKKIIIIKMISMMNKNNRIIKKNMIKKTIKIIKLIQI